MTLVELCVVGVLCVLVTAMTVDQRRRDALGVGTLQGDMRLLAPVWSEAHHYGISSNTVAGSDSSTSHSDWAIPMSSMYQCQYPGCQKESAFDPNTGAQNEYCHEHIQYTQMLQDDIPTAAAASTVWGRVLGSAFTSWFQSQTQRALSNVIRSQHILSLHKRTQSARSETVLARPVTASPGQVQQSITMPQVTLVQAQQAIPVPQTIPGEIDHVYIADTQ